MYTRVLSALLIAALVPVLGGCVAAAGVGAATGASAYHDRRSTGAFVDDEIIELKFAQQLADDALAGAKSHINATSMNNIVLLTGETPSQALRTRIVALARSINKVRRVLDEITVAAPSSMLSRSSDTYVTAKVKTAIIDHDTDVALRTKVVTEKGVVYLMGLLSHTEADKVTELARRVGGVQRVVKLFEYIG